MALRLANWLPHKDWHQVALKAYSMYAMYVLIAIEAIDNFAPYLVDYTSPSWVKGALFVNTVAAIYLRTVPQSNIPGAQAPVGASSAPEDKT